MPQTDRARRKIRAPKEQQLALLALCACLLWCDGCFTRKSHAQRPVAIAFMHPTIPVAMSAAELGKPPDLELEVAPPPRLVTPRSAPARPRPAQTTPAEPAVVRAPADPIIIPDLTAEQLNAAKSETQHSLDIAERNLSQTQGKKLNSAQEDVASKIRGFMETARDAMRNSDWQRARNLAKKAEVLSHELVANL